MRRLGLLVLAANAVLLLLRRRRRGPRESVSVHYGDGSMVRLEPGAPGFERLVGLARQAL
jgi:hypothetical protein